MIPVNRPLITDEDIQAVTAAMGKGSISGDTDIVRDCEQVLEDILEVEHAILVNSGTSAIDIAVESLEIGPGQECLVPSFTIMSSVNQLLRNNAKIRLVDADPVTWSMDLEQTHDLLDSRTKLVLPVHIYGYPLDLTSRVRRSRETGTKILEDAAESFGSKIRDRAIGTFGDVGIYSFYANKVVTGGEGGAIVTRDSKVATTARRLRNLNFSSVRFVHQGIGWNARLNSMSAALIKSQLGRLDKLIGNKRNIGERYKEGLKDHPWFIHPANSNGSFLNSFWVYGIVLNSDSKYDAAQMQELLERKYQIQTRRFFCPIHLQPFIKNYDVSYSNLQVSEWLWNRGFYLPSGLGNTADEIDRVIEILWKLV